jgi:hypothetical protein
MANDREYHQFSSTPTIRVWAAAFSDLTTEAGAMAIRSFLNHSNYALYLCGPNYFLDLYIAF